MIHHYILSSHYVYILTFISIHLELIWVCLVEWWPLFFSVTKFADHLPRISTTGDYGMGWDGMGWNASRSTNPHEQTIPTIKARWKTIHMNPQMQVGLHELHTMIILLDSRNYTGGNAGKSKGLLTGLEAQNCSHIFTGKCNCLVWEKKNLKSVW